MGDRDSPPVYSRPSSPASAATAAVAQHSTSHQPGNQQTRGVGLGGWGEGFTTARCLREGAVPAVEQRLLFLRGQVLQTFIRGRGEGRAVVEDFGSRS